MYRDGFATSMVWLLLIALVPALASCSDGTPGGCGSDNDCKGNRVCSGGMCVDPGPGGDGAGGGGDLAMGDPCAAAGGTRGPNGACTRSCVWDRVEAGHDLNGDCKGLGWVCYDDKGFWSTVTDHCHPAANCMQDSDCGQGWKCIQEKYPNEAQPRHSCQPGPCTTSADCPADSYCLTSCPKGYYSPVNFCIYGKASAPPTDCG